VGCSPKTSASAPDSLPWQPTENRLLHLTLKAGPQDTPPPTAYALPATTRCGHPWPIAVRCAKGIGRTTASGRRNGHVGALAAFGTYFVGFVGRPIGGAIFGHYGDRIGRKTTLIVTLLLMGIATVLVGLVPGYDRIGIWGAVLLTVLRMCQGLGVGGEWGGSALLSMEWGHKGKRGFIAGWPQFGVPAGLLLSNGVVALFSPSPAFLTWGWRVPFLLSIVLVGGGLFIRLRILETPLFARLLAERRIEYRPVREVVRRNRKEIVLSALLRLSEQSPFYLFTTFVFTYGTVTLKLDRSLLVNAVTFAALVSLASVPFFGYLSDVIGRKWIYILGAAAMLVFAYPYFALFNTMARRRRSARR